MSEKKIITNEKNGIQSNNLIAFLLAFSQIEKRTLMDVKQYIKMFSSFTRMNA